MKLLEGKTAIVTGAHRGIGKAILETFAKYGSNIICVNRQPDAAFSEHCSSLESNFGISVDICYADFSEEVQVSAAAKQIISRKIPIDILVNNVGIANPLSMFTMTKMDTIKHAFDVNFYSSIAFTQIIARSMMKNRQGSIVFTSSSAAFDGGANIEYCASKAALIGASRRLAVELGKFGIRVNTVAPGLTATDMGNSMSPEDEAIAIDMNIMHRKGEPSEIADAVAFLASDMSKFITGQVLRVDGGLIK